MFNAAVNIHINLFLSGKKVTAAASERAGKSRFNEKL